MKNRTAYGQNAYFQHEGYEIPDFGLAVKLGSAKAIGEFLISLTRQTNPLTYKITDRKTLMRLMNEMSWNTFHRTFAIESPDVRRGYQLYFNAEMLMGDSDVTQHIDIQRLFERMDIKHDLRQYSYSLPDNVVAYVDSINEETSISIDRSGETKFHVLIENNHTVLVFEFGGAQIHRSQKVMLYTCEERCVFVSRASRQGFCKVLNIKEIIKYTWMRNR